MSENKELRRLRKLYVRLYHNAMEHLRLPHDWGLVVAAQAMLEAAEVVLERYLTLGGTRSSLPPETLFRAEDQAKLRNEVRSVATVQGLLPFLH